MKMQIFPAYFLTSVIYTKVHVERGNVIDEMG
jgi:hypothetical protein